MKNLIIATAMALSSMFVFAGPSQAQGASVTITTGDGPRYHSERVRERDYRPRGHYVRETHRPRHGCMTKKVRSYRNGHMVVKTTKVCR